MANAKNRQKMKWKYLIEKLLTPDTFIQKNRNPEGLTENQAKLRIVTCIFP